MKFEPHDFQLLTFRWDGFNSEVRISLLFTIVILIISAVIFLITKASWPRFIRQSDVELDIKLGKVGSVKIKPNNEVRQIAHKAWAELVTRKAGIPIDRENDIILDVYESWYELFKEIRHLVRDVPAHKLDNPDTKELVNVLIKTLNDGLRPHLTQWQAKYKRWYGNAVSIDVKSALTPQDIQKKYKNYDALVDDMLKVNRQLVEYAKELKKLLD